MTALCGGGEQWCRKVKPCPYCRARRRHLFRFEMSGYGFRLICGGCGNEWGDGEPEHRTKLDKRRNRERVQREWPTARGDSREQLKRLLEEGK